MKSLSQLTLLSLLAVALFVPQKSHAAFNWGKWIAIGTGVIGVSYIGYKICKSFSAKNEEIIEEKIKELEKEKERLEKEIELKIQEEEKLKSGPKKFVATRIELTRPAIFIGSRYTELNKQYGIEHEIDAFDFTDLCGILLDDNDEKIYVPLRLLSKNYPIWADYFSKNKEEYPNKIITIGSCQIDMSRMPISGVKAWYKHLTETPYDCFSHEDRQELVKRGANFNATIERTQINEQSDEILTLKRQISTLKKVPKELSDKTIIIGAIDNDTPLYIGSQHEEINKHYNITKEDQKIVFTDICISGFSWKNSKNKTKFYIPIEQFNAMAIGWSNYYDKTNKEYPHKTIKIGSYELDFNSLKTSYLTQAYNVLSKQTPTFLTEDVDKLVQCGVLKEHPKNLLLNKD